MRNEAGEKILTQTLIKLAIKNWIMWANFLKLEATLSVLENVDKSLSARRFKFIEIPLS